MEEKTNYLAHHGIRGQKWGVRRYQNLDGSLTPAGRRRLSALESSHINTMSSLEADINKRNKSLDKRDENLYNAAEEREKAIKYRKKVDKFERKANRAEDKSDELKRVVWMPGPSAIKAIKKIDRLDAKTERFDKKAKKYRDKAEASSTLYKEYNEKAMVFDLKSKKAQLNINKGKRALEKIHTKMDKIDPDYADEGREEVEYLLERERYYNEWIR